jgi:hypothetical protein|tara:strand:- start:3731 stop:4423 length:693 start_codon:yes stop_codon:yes gene_type:complete
MISVVQNFICTIDERRNALLNNLPKLGEVFKDITFYVNFNDSVNFDIIYDSYNKHIKNLNFYNNLEKNWALVTLSLVEEVKTPYLLYLCEDQILHSTPEDLNNILNEIQELDIDFANLTKIKKYSKNTFKGYTEHNYGYSYLGKDSPTGRLSSDCIVKTQFWKDRLIEFIDNKHNCPHSIPYPHENLPNYFEGYYDNSIGIKKFKDLKCYIPKQAIFVEYNDILQKHTYV